MDTRTIVNKYRNRIKDDHIYFAPDIPDKKLQNAIGSYASDLTQADVLLLVDNTVFRSAKTGLLITADSIYYAATFGESGCLRIDETKFINADFGIVSTDISLNNGDHEFYLNQMPRKQIKIIVELLRELISSSRCEPEILEAAPISINTEASLECRSCGAQITLSVSICEYCETPII